MTDNCAYEKDDGEPCQLPASRDDGRCHHHTETGERANGGRDFAIAERDHEEILEAAELGASKAGGARAAGTTRQALDRYLEAHPDFRTAFARARHRGERELLRGALFRSNDDDETPDMDGQHARFILSTSFKYAEKTEVENTGDEPLTELTIDFNDVDT